LQQHIPRTLNAEKFAGDPNGAFILSKGRTGPHGDARGNIWANEALQGRGKIDVCGSLLLNGLQDMAFATCHDGL
jgi:hypothetical protein